MSIAPQSNPPINPQYYEPSRFVISDITRGLTTTVTTSEDHNYVIGQLVRINIPNPYGIQQISRQQAYVLSIPASDEVVIDIDSRDYNAFIASPIINDQSPAITAIGDINSGQVNSSGSSNQKTYVPGSFIDISPA